MVEAIGSISVFGHNSYHLYRPLIPGKGGSNFGDGGNGDMEIKKG